MTFLSGPSSVSALSSRFDPDSSSRRRWPVWRLNLLVSLWLAFPANLALLRELLLLPELHNARGVGLALALGLMIASGLMALLSLFAWRGVLKPVITLLLVIAAAGAYFMLAYRVVIDPTMMVNVLQTDWHETRDLLHPLLFVALLVLAVLPAWWVWRTPLAARGVLAQAWRNMLMALVSLALLAGVALAAFQGLSSTMREHKSLRYTINPFNSLYAIGRVVAGVNAQRSRPLLVIGEDARAGAPDLANGKPQLLLFVIGETARAANFSLNGYARNTNPGLAAQGVASFRQVYSCGTSTASSLPCMFSHLARKDFESSDNDYQNLLDVLQRAGLAVLWIDNQSGCKGLCDRIPSVSPHALHLSAGCEGDACFDAIMLQGLDQRIAAMPAEQRARGVVLVLHQMGSHGPAYYKRSPPDSKPFLPECKTSALQQCDRQAVVNGYDNTIATTDRFLTQAIDWLKTQESHYAPSLLYVSDHGESLGENNLYLHGLPYALAPDEQKHVPLIVWLSPQAQARRGASMECLKGRLDEPLSHDNLFHSVLGLAGVTTALYQRPLDLFSACAGR